MLVTNTNLIADVVQGKLSKTSSGLNDTIQRMTTGFKINCAGDNAANFGISTNMDTKMGGYMMVEDNISMGLDMVNTTSMALDGINDRLTRLRMLQEQSLNATYGPSSQSAINAEVNALVDEVKRLFETSEYNGIRLFGDCTDGAFINDVVKRDTTGMLKLSELAAGDRITAGTYVIESEDDLVKLAEKTNSGMLDDGCEFVLGCSLDLSSIDNWTSIGKESAGATSFRGTIDGNGYVIRGLKQETSEDIAGLFGFVTGDFTVKNLGIEDAEINADYDSSALAGILAGYIEADNINISNCYTTGDINSGYITGGMFGLAGANGSTFDMDNCYTNVTIKGLTNWSGGISGQFNCTSGTINMTNCEAQGNIQASGKSIYNGIGSFIANTINIQNSGFTGNIYGSANTSMAGIGDMEGVTNIDKCYVLGNISNTNASHTAGLCTNLYSSTTITNSYVSGNVSSAANNTTATFAFLKSTSTNDVSNCYYQKNAGNDFIRDTDLMGTTLGTYSNIQTFNGKPPVGPFANTNEFETVRLQVGIESTHTSSLDFTIGFAIKGLDQLRNIGKRGNYLDTIDEYQNTISALQTEYGAVQNRLESALNSNSIQLNNLTSCHSTIKDADIALESSSYIKNQILQQASATLLATANQTPRIALQLL